MVNIDTLQGVFARLFINGAFAIFTVIIAVVTIQRIGKSKITGKMRHAVLPLFIVTFLFFVVMTIDRYWRYFLLKTVTTPFVFRMMEGALYQVLKISTYIFYAVRLREAFLRSQDLKTSDWCFGLYFAIMILFAVGTWVNWAVNPHSYQLSFALGFVFDLVYQLVLAFMFANKLRWIARMQIAQNPEQFRDKLPFEDVIVRSLVLVSISCVISLLVGILSGLTSVFLLELDAFGNLICVVLVFTFFDPQYYCCCRLCHAPLVGCFNTKTRSSTTTIDTTRTFGGAKMSIHLSKTRDSEVDITRGSNAGSVSPNPPRRDTDASDFTDELDNRAGSLSTPRSDEQIAADILVAGLPKLTQLPSESNGGNEDE